jgi:hypothetical protein
VSTNVQRIVVVAFALVAVVLIRPSPASAALPAASPEGDCHAVTGRSLVVATMPTVVGFIFAVDDRQYRTDSSGKARIESMTCNDTEQALAPVSGDIDQGGGTTATFDGWYGDEFLGRTRGSGTIYAAFRQRTRVDLALVDLQGAPVERSQVGTIVIKGSTGAEVEVPPDRSWVLLDSSRVVRFSAGLVSKDILWSVQSAEIGGNTAVNRGEVRFEPRKTDVVTIPLLLYTLRMTVRDTILHRPVGEVVSVIAPDGSVRTVELGSGASGEVGPLARGQYTLVARGGLIAINFRQPVAISRLQEAQLTVVSYVDLAIGGGVFLVVTVGLLLVGRRLGGRPTPGPGLQERRPDQRRPSVVRPSGVRPRVPARREETT